MSIEFVKEDFYYDLFVPFYNNYISNGFINHNSTKSSFISTAIILLMEANPNVHCVCFRKYAANLADSVYSQFEYTLNQKLRPLAKHWVFKRSPLKIVNVNTGQQILFRGLDDPQKVKSLKAPFGYFGLVYWEELAEFDGIEEIRNVNQSLHRGGHYFQTFCAYNPPETSSNWVNYEASVPQIVDGQLYRKVYRSDYRSVPVEWLGKNFFIEAELLKNTNERAYRHEYLGEVTGNGGAIFPNVKAMTMTDEMISKFANRKFGIDWGFAIDPACFLAMNYDKTRRTLYIYDEIYDVEMTNQVFGGLIKQKDIGFDYIMCDAAEPKSIAEFESLGINALAAQKGPDSVRFSTKWLQSLCNIYIDPIRCPNAFREFSQYEYEKNKSGQFVSKYPDKNNHAIDACVVGGTLVHTTSGAVTISSLVGKSGKLLGYDSDGIVRAVDFKNCRLTRNNAKVRRLGFEGGIEIICTPDHRILTPDGYVEAENIGPFSKAITWDGIRNSTYNVYDKDEVADVYDLEVPATHNFIVNGGLVIHNCRYGMMEDAISAGLF